MVAEQLIEMSCGLDSLKVGFSLSEHDYQERERREGGGRDNEKSMVAEQLLGTLLCHHQSLSILPTGE